MEGFPIKDAASKTYNRWVSEQEHWVKEIVEQIHKTIENIRHQVQTYTEKLMDLDNFINNHLEAEKKEWNERNPQEGRAIRVVQDHPIFDHDGNIVDEDDEIPHLRDVHPGFHPNRKVYRKLAKDYMANVGNHFFPEYIEQVLVNGYVRLTVNLSVLADMLLPENSVATIDSAHVSHYLTLYSQDEFENSALIFEIALDTVSFAEFERGGHRFINEVVRMVIAKFISVEKIRVAPILKINSGDNKLYMRNIGFYIEFEPYKSSSASLRDVHTRRTQYDINAGAIY